jgi:large subunit ribosomal protein L31e
MAAKQETKIIERTYNVPLRKEYMKVPRWKRTKKAVTALRQFLSKHMKSDDVKLSLKLNQKVWQHGIKNPPHHVKVTVTKDDKGVVNADLFGAKTEVKKDAPKKEIKKETAKTEAKPKEIKEEIANAEKPEVAEEQAKAQVPETEVKETVEVSKEKQEPVKEEPAEKKVEEKEVKKE